MFTNSVPVPTFSQYYKAPCLSNFTMPSDQSAGTLNDSYKEALSYQILALAQDNDEYCRAVEALILQRNPS